MYKDTEGVKDLIRDIDLIQQNGKDKFVHRPISKLILGRKGCGKSVLIEKFIEREYESGSLIIVLTDDKDVLESGFMGIEPEDPQQLEELKKLGKKPEAKPIKIYHPFTFLLQKNKEYPSFLEFFTFDIKNLDDKDFCLLSEHLSNTEIVRSLNFAVDKLGDNEDLYDFIFNIEEYSQTEGIFYKGIVIPKRVEPLFTKAGFNVDKSDIKNVGSFFLDIIEKNYMVANHNCPYNIDFEKLIKDQHHIHIFVTKFLDNDKLKYWTMFKIIKEINKLQDKVKKRIVFVMDEITNLVPAETKENYIIYTAGLTSKYLRNVRSKFKYGGLIIAGGQVFSDIMPSVANGFDEHHIGCLSGINDIGRLRKILTLNNETIRTWIRLPVGHFICLQDENFDIYKVRFPKSGHKHIGMDFFDQCKCLGLVKNYNEVIDYFQNYKQAKIKLMQERVKQAQEDMKKFADTKEKYYESKSNTKQKLKELQSRDKAQKDEIKEKIKQRFKELWTTDNPETLKPYSYSEIAEVITKEIKPIHKQSIFDLKNKLVKDKEIEPRIE